MVVKCFHIIVLPATMQQDMQFYACTIYSETDRVSLERRTAIIHVENVNTNQSNLTTISAAYAGILLYSYIVTRIYVDEIIQLEDGVTFKAQWCCYNEINL